MGKVHIVKQGEKLESISREYGFSDWHVIYNHSSNLAFRQKRPNPRQIHPGDRLYIPAKTAGLVAQQNAKAEFFLTVNDTITKIAFSNLTLKLKLPNGAVKEFKTDALGRIRLKDPQVTPGKVDILAITDQAGSPHISYSTFTKTGLATNKCELLNIPNKRKTINDIATKQSITRRSAWGTMTPKYALMDQDWNYHTIAIHHSGNGGAKIPTEIESKHMSSKGWYDVGYHFMITPDGKIYEGRHLTFKGSHVNKANTGKIGILVMGDFQHQLWDWDDDPTKKQLSSLNSLILTLKSAFPTISKLGGHRDYNATACPGDELYKLIPDIRAKTKLGGP